MQYADIIAREADTLPVDKQAEVLDFIEFLKQKQLRAEAAAMPKTAQEIEAFFRGFDVNIAGYQFDREDANAR